MKYFDNNHFKPAMSNKLCQLHTQETLMTWQPLGYPTEEVNLRSSLSRIYSSAFFHLLSLRIRNTQFAPYSSAGDALIKNNMVQRHPMQLSF